MSANELPERVTSGGSDSSHLTKSGEPDRRFKEHGGGQHGNQGSSPEMDGDGSSRLQTEGISDTPTYKASEHGGQKKDGGQDARLSSEHGFGGDRERASEAGKKGGSASYENDGLEH